MWCINKLVLGNLERVLRRIYLYCIRTCKRFVYVNCEKNLYIIYIKML